MKLFGIALIVVAFCALSSRATSLAGKVVDRNNAPLESVSIVTDVHGVGAQSDSVGIFHLTTNEPITRVTFSSIGYRAIQYKADEVPEVVMLERSYFRGTDIVVHASRAEKGLASIAFDDLSRAEIERDYTVGEFPLLLKTTPNVFTYAEAGSPLGATSVRIRGFDDRRVVTYINGVPLNDPEDQSTYFVDLPDFAANIADVQVQRGVGNSLYGDASFGGTVNVITKTLDTKRKAVLTAGYGGFTSDGDVVSDVYKRSFEFASGLVDGRWAFAGRFSKQKSAGYRHNSWYDGWAYYLSATRLDPRMTTEIHLYGGPIRYHAAWYGASRSEISKDRRTNVGIPGYDELNYKNATDNFSQPHYQLHHTFRINDRSTLYNTFYYIQGTGYYEQFRPYSDYVEYNIDPIHTDGANSGDVVRQKWVEKRQYGWNARIDHDHKKGTHTLGGSLYNFQSHHWGQVVWAQHITGDLNPRHRYYEYHGKKWVGSIYAQERYEFTDRLSTQLTAQLRFQHYSFDQTVLGAFVGYDYTVDWLFFSPRIGLHFAATERLGIYGNLSVASRVPTDDAIYNADDPDALPALARTDSTLIEPGRYDYTFGDPTVKSERLYDLELGCQYDAPRIALSANLFWMKFKDMIVAEGGVSDGIENTLNVNGAVHAGVELAATFRPVDALTLDANIALNRNRITDFVHVISYDFDTTGAPSSEEATSVDLSGKTVSRFPVYLGNLMADFQNGAVRLTWRSRFIGRQYADLHNIESESIDPVSVSSLSAAVTINALSSIGRLTLSATVDNLFDRKYESAVAYAENYAYRNANESAAVGAWSTYFVAPERSFFIQAQLEAF